MRRALLLGLTGVLLLPGRVSAEDHLIFWGNYYKERSTRVVEPMVKLSKELPHDVSLEVSYLVDQITSASGAFTASDEPFQEYRNDVSVGAKIKLADTWTPGLSARVSYEPDYTSLTFGASLGLSLNQDNTVASAYAQLQKDDIGWRADPSFEDQLTSTLVGVSLTQLLARDLSLTGSLEAQFLRGYQENPYRVENHPRRRNRYTVALAAAYEIPQVAVAALLRYRLYADTWKLVSHGVELELSRALTPALEVGILFRYHTQDDVYFTTLSEDFFQTSDPKLFAFNSEVYGLRLRIRAEFLRDTALSGLAASTIEPSYLFFNQHNFYGAAHMVQLGWCVPF